MFNKELHIAKFKIHLDKLISYLQNKGIEFTANNGFENVIFRNKDKELKICHHCFYRFSGIACIYKDGQEKNSIEAVEVTDDMFMNSYMRSIIEHNFNVK